MNCTFDGSRLITTNSSPEESFYDKPAAVMLKSGLAEQLVEADVLRLVKPEGVFITQSWGT